MYKKLRETERRERRERYRGNLIYRILYTPLWRQRGDDLSPEDVWTEANNLSFSLKTEIIIEPSVRVQELFDDLCERYTIFELEDGKHVIRGFAEAEHSAMMVSIASFLLLVNIYPEAKNHPYLSVCNAIYDIVCDIHGFKEIYEEARKNEDEYERRGEFIEIGDLIEQIAYEDQLITESQITFAKKVIGEIIEDQADMDYATLRDNEILLSRANDKHNHCFQNEVDRLRVLTRKKLGNEESDIIYENYIFNKDYDNKIAEIRNAIYPFVHNGVEHINVKEQKQWLSIIEPLKQIDNLLLEHENRPKQKKCTDAEICHQMNHFFIREFPTDNYKKITKSISAERNKWRKDGIGLTFEDWTRYLIKTKGKNKETSLVKIAQRVYGEVKRVIKG